MSSEASGVHRRAFEHGLVLVNPTGSTHTVTFGGTYSGSGLTDATGASMPAHSALVLTGTSEPVSASSEPETPPVSSPAPPVQPIPVVVTIGQNEASLKWKQPKRTKVRTYAVIRNSSTARTKRLRRVERGVASGRLYRLRVVGTDRRGHVVAKSKVLWVRGQRAASTSSLRARAGARRGRDTRRPSARSRTSRRGCVALRRRARPGARGWPGTHRSPQPAPRPRAGRRCRRRR